MKKNFSLFPNENEYKEKIYGIYLKNNQSQTIHLSVLQNLTKTKNIIRERAFEKALVFLLPKTIYYKIFLSD